jgi:PAS domain S-box-containing protein
LEDEAAMADRKTATGRGGRRGAFEPGRGEGRSAVDGSSMTFDHARHNGSGRDMQPAGNNGPVALSQDTLAAAREYRRALFDNLHDAVIIHDLNGRVVDVNNKMLEIYRMSREEAIGLSILADYSSGADPEMLERQPYLWKRVLAGEGQLFEWKARRPHDGSTFDVEVSLTKLSLPEGDFIQATTRDISERKKVERELVATKNYLNTVFNNIHDAIFLHDVNGKVVDVNDKMLEMYGCTREEAIGLSIIPDYALDDGIVDQPALWKRTLQGENHFFECRGRRPRDGYEFDGEIFVTRLSLPEGDFVLGNVRDITERKRIEKQLHAEKQNFQTVAESSPVGMVMIGADDGFRFKYMNPKFRELFGHGGIEMSGLDDWLEQAYPDPVFRRRAALKWNSILKTIKPGAGRAYIRKVSGRDGTDKQMKFVPVLLETREILMACWDITENMEAEQRTRERNLMLEVLNDIMASVGRSLRLSEILETLKRIFAEKLKIDAGAVFLRREADGKTHMEMCWGVPEEARQAWEGFALACYGAGKVIEADDVTLVRNRMIDLDAKLVAPFRRYRLYGYLCMPLIVEDEMQGMIFLAERKRDSFSDDRLVLYKTFGQQISVAIQNALLFEQVRESHAQMKALSLRLVDVQEAERRYVARELHDEIGQELTGLKLALEMRALKNSEASGELAEAQGLVNRLMGLVRELSLKLRPAMLDDLGLLPTLLWHFERFTNNTSIRVTFRQKGIAGVRFPLQLETAVYRIIQEALTNVARHAKVSEVDVRLWADKKSMGVQIEDSGVGFTVDAGLGRLQTNGLSGMRERAMLLGGTFTIESHPGEGTCLTAEIPISLGSQES